MDLVLALAREARRVCEADSDAGLELAQDSQAHDPAQRDLAADHLAHLRNQKVAEEEEDCYNTGPGTEEADHLHVVA